MPQSFEHRDNSLAKFAPQLSYWVESAFDQCHQLSGGKFGLGVITGDDLLLRPILLQRGCRGSVRVREGPCKSGQEMRKRLEKAKAGKRREKRTVKSIL
jgi:hypothetical protein